MYHTGPIRFCGGQWHNVICSVIWFPVLAVPCAQIYFLRQRVSEGGAVFWEYVYEGEVGDEAKA